MSGASIEAECSNSACARETVHALQSCGSSGHVNHHVGLTKAACWRVWHERKKANEEGIEGRVPCSDPAPTCISHLVTTCIMSVTVGFTTHTLFAPARLQDPRSGKSSEEQRYRRIDPNICWVGILLLQKFRRTVSPVWSCADYQS